MSGFFAASTASIGDINVRVCLMSSGEINWEALREIYPTRQERCFISWLNELGQNWTNSIRCEHTSLYLQYWY